MAACGPLRLCACARLFVASRRSPARLLLRAVVGVCLPGFLLRRRRRRTLRLRISRRLSRLLSATLICGGGAPRPSPSQSSVLATGPRPARAFSAAARWSVDSCCVVALPIFSPCPAPPRRGSASGTTGRRRACRRRCPPRCRCSRPWPGALRFGRVAGDFDVYLRFEEGRALAHRLRRDEVVHEDAATAIAVGLGALLRQPEVGVARLVLVADRRRPADGPGRAVEPRRRAADERLRLVAALPPSAARRGLAARGCSRPRRRAGAGPRGGPTPRGRRRRRRRRRRHRRRQRRRRRRRQR